MKKIELAKQTWVAGMNGVEENKKQDIDNRNGANLLYESGLILSIEKYDSVG